MKRILSIALDPEQGHARAMLGIHKWTRNDLKGGLDLAFDAYRLEPQNPDVCVRLGTFRHYSGLTGRALPFIQQAIDLDPVNARNDARLSCACLNMGDIDGALAAGQQMEGLGFPSMRLVVATVASGEQERAVDQCWQTRLLTNTVVFPPVGSQFMTPEQMDTYWKFASTGVCSSCEEDRRAYGQLREMLHVTLPDAADPAIVNPAAWTGYVQMVFKMPGPTDNTGQMFSLMSI